MKNLLLALVFASFYQLSNAQDGNTIGFACGYGGGPTEVVRAFSWELKSQDYQWISEQLASGQAPSKYLATVIIEKLDSLNLYQATSTDWDKIAEVKNSDEEVFVCSGCTFYQKMKLKDMFVGSIFSEASYWFKKQASGEE